jgi:hypothetical protein
MLCLVLVWALKHSNQRAKHDQRFRVNLALQPGKLLGEQRYLHIRASSAMHHFFISSDSFNLYKSNLVGGPQAQCGRQRHLLRGPPPPAFDDPPTSKYLRNPGHYQ